MEQFQYPGEIRWEEETYTQFYGKLIVESLERGYAITLGNSLRRVLLSSIGGLAITAVKIDGVPHEFTTIPGVVEDVTDIVINLKQVYLRSNISEIPEEPFRVELKGPGEVTAKDLFPGPEMTVLNSDLHIATLGEGVTVSMELTVRRGFGYVPVARMASEINPIGTIPLAASFSPVTRVRIHTDNTRVGQRVDYERLTMEIWTNGTVSPKESVDSATDILVRHFRDITTSVPGEKPVPALAETGEAVKEAGEEITGQTAADIAEIGISTRIVNVLKSHGLLTVDDLCALSRKEISNLPNIGPKAVEEIVTLLAGQDLSPRKEK